MPAPVDQQFYRAAREPLDRAAQLFAQGDVSAGLAALHRDRLMAALRMGVRSVATAAGITPLKVFRLLPMDRVDSLSESLHAAHVSAQANLGAATERVDAATATSGLANELADWETALDVCREAIARTKQLEKASRRRSLKRQTAVVLLVMSISGATTWFVRRELSRARVAQALDADVCAIGAIAAPDLERASSEQHARLQQAQDACQERHERKRREAEERQRAEQARQAAKRKREALVEACAELGRHFVDHELSEADRALLGEHRALFDRVASGKIEPDDATVELDELACADTATGAILRNAYGRALLHASLKWLHLRTPSKSAVKAMTAQKKELPRHLAPLLRGHIELAAGQGVLSRGAKDIARGTTLCSLSLALDLGPGRNCAAVQKMAEER